MSAHHKYNLVNKKPHPKAKRLTSAPTATTAAATKTRLTRVERARQEAILSFGGNTLDSVLDCSKKKISRTLQSSGGVKKKAPHRREAEENVAGEGEEMEVEGGDDEVSQQEGEISSRDQRRLDMCRIASLALHMWPIAAVDFFNLFQPFHTCK